MNSMWKKEAERELENGKLRSIGKWRKEPLEKDCGAWPLAAAKGKKKDSTLGFKRNAALSIL